MTIITLGHENASLSVFSCQVAPKKTQVKKGLSGEDSLGRIIKVSLSKMFGKYMIQDVLDALIRG